MKLSIVIPAKNEQENLPRLFASLDKQTFRDFEVIVADAGSTDDTRSIAKAAGARIVPGGMPGPGRNAGAEHALGEYFLFLDADIVLPSEAFLQDVLAEFDSCGFDVATCMLTPVSTKKRDKVLTGFYNTWSRVTEKFLPHLVGSTVLVRRTLHQALGGFDETVVFAEDMDYGRRALKHGKFGFLKSHRMPMNVRRLEKDGRLGTAVRFTLAELYMIFIGPIRTDIFKYRFDYTAKK